MTTASAVEPGAAPSWRLSIIIEWANTIWNGEARAVRLLDRIHDEWQAICADRYPDDLPREAIALLQGRGPRHELLIVSGAKGVEALAAEFQRRVPESFDVKVHVSEGLEYYPLKNFGARLANGDFLLFVDSDVLPEQGWLAHLLGSFARPDVRVVCGQTFVEPSGFYSRAFALGWSYQLRDKSAGFVAPRKFYANNIVFRADVFRESPFPSVGPRSRGACSALGRTLASRGIRVWENRRTGVDHPPPAWFRHMAVRALVHGRDYYLGQGPERSLRGVATAVRIAWERLIRGFRTTMRHWRDVGLRRHEIPAAMAVMSVYYATVALGGLLTHISPRLTLRFRL